MRKRGSDWIAEKGFKNKEKYIQFICPRCGKHFERIQWYYKLLMKNNQGRGPFCSRRCAVIARNVSPEQRRKVSESQKGISVMSRGRKGHVVSPETREKLRLAKLGKPAPQDHNIILSELEFRNIKKFAVTHGLVPDAIYIENGKLVALEVEKESAENGIRRKMQQYDNRTDYDKVVIVWYRKNDRVTEFIKENGVWTKQ